MLDYPEGGDSQRPEIQAQGISLSFLAHSSFLEFRPGHEGAGLIGDRVLTPSDLTQFSGRNTAGSSKFYL